MHDDLSKRTPQSKKKEARVVMEEECNRVKKKEKEMGVCVETKRS